MSNTENLPPSLFDPSEHNVDEVNAHLATADADERARVLGLEDAPEGKGRATVTREFPDADDDETTPPPAPEGAPATTVQPKRYTEGENRGWAVGQYAPHARYGTLGSDGSVTPVEGDEPPAGRGVVIVVEGDVVTAAKRDALGLTD